MLQNQSRKTADVSGKACSCKLACVCVEALSVDSSVGLHRWLGLRLADDLMSFGTTRADAVCQFDENGVEPAYMSAAKAPHQLDMP